MKRYGSTSEGMVETPDGPYVRYEEIAKLRGAIEDALEELETNHVDDARRILEATQEV